MRTDDFDYILPESLIAQHPAEPRDSSRLMICHRDSHTVEHRVFSDIVEYFRPHDALILNETRVLPARLVGAKLGTGGAMEFLLLKRISLNIWEILVKPGRRATIGSEFIFGGQLRASILEKTPGGGRVVEFFYDGAFEALLDKFGQMPLPPYITEPLKDKSRYQTVYAKADGSSAAPTAGLHFTPALLEQIARANVDIVPVLLHVGLGTFRPVKADEIAQHVMHSEFCEITNEAVRRIDTAKSNGGRIICTGTTSVRTLETASAHGTLRPFSGRTDIFISPGYQFKSVDALITNFHLPKSTLLMLISAFMGREFALKAYADAIRLQYRFFSFGDAMLIL